MSAAVEALASCAWKRLRSCSMEVESVDIEAQCRKLNAQCSTLSIPSSIAH
jgi:hypothetical protein